MDDDRGRGCRGATLEFSTGIAVAFPRSPMIAAQIAWELAGNTSGRFRLGLGSQVKAHITRRYGAEFERPAARLRDYVLAVKACLAAFRGDAKLAHDGPFYALNLLRREWLPPRHEYGDVKVDIAAVGPLMCRGAGEVADGVHVHPMHSMHYIRSRLLPAIGEGAAKAGRDPAAIDLIVPVFAIPGDSAEERAALVARTKTQLAFYGLHPQLRLSIRRPSASPAPRTAFGRCSAPATRPARQRRSPTRCLSISRSRRVGTTWRTR